MKTIKNPKEGMIYHVTNKDKSETIDGILLSIAQHPCKEALYYTFFTTEKCIYEAYEDELTIEAGATIKDNIRKLLKEYYQLYANMQELEIQRKNIDMQEGSIWAQQNKIMQQIDMENGIENPNDWLSVIHQPEEPDIVAEKIQIATESIKETADNIRKSWVGQNLYEKLDNFFDSMWENIEKSNRKKHVTADINCHTP